MWNEWKKKIKDLFIADSHESNEQKARESGQHDRVQSKVMYQYPNKKSFRFPVIPDQTSEKNTIHKPAYERKRSGNKQPSVQSRTQKLSQESNIHKKTQQREEKSMVENHTFRPTQVASPIYGYNRRKKDKEMENIPAYVRKHLTEESDIQEEKHSNPVDQEVLTQNDKMDDTNVVDFDEQYTNEPIQEEQTNFEQVVEKENELIEPLHSPIKKSDHRSEHKIKAGENVRNKNNRQSEIEKSRPNKNDTSVLPFNVMMSANDKRRHNDRLHKKTTPGQSNTNRTIPFHLLNDPKPDDSQDQVWINEQQELLEKTLKHFNVKAKVVNATQGPSVTRFEVQPELGVKVSKVKNLSDDLKLNMAAKDIRIEAPIPGKNTIGIEIPNPTSQMVGLQEIFATEAFNNSSSPLTIALGLNIEGAPLITNIQKMPHGLIAGATGSGKSVCINTILVSLLYKANHEDVKFLLIDPKMVELAPYNAIPHLVSPVITNVKAATVALKWAVNEMEDRYEKFVQEGVRDIERYNQKMKKQERSDEKMPFLVIVIDELADLMMVSPQDVEDAICRIAQKARACGIHLLVATQRPSVDVITGLIKSNIPTRIAFSVSSQVDSRTIIDTSGAEKLLGKGDMLFVENGAGKSVRLQGAFVSDEEIERVTKHARSIAPPNYLFEQEQLLEKIDVDDEADVLLEEAIAFVVQQNSASTSLMQRHFKIGYNRAARLMDTMEVKGVISQQNGSKPREVLITQTHLEDIQD